MNGDTRSLENSSYGIVWKDGGFPTKGFFGGSLKKDCSILGYIL